jgi:hypothetical protein
MEARTKRAPDPRGSGAATAGWQAPAHVTKEDALVPTQDARPQLFRRPEPELAASFESIAKNMDWAQFFRDLDSGALARHRDEMLADFELNGLTPVQDSEAVDASSNAAWYRWFRPPVDPTHRSAVGKPMPRRPTSRLSSATSISAAVENEVIGEVELLVRWCARVKARLAHA